MSDFHLTVLQDFSLPPPDGRYFRKGDHIDDSETVDLILGGELIHHVVKVSPVHEDVTWHARQEAAKVAAPVVAPVVAHHFDEDHA